MSTIEWDRDALRNRLTELEAALAEALDEWEYAAQYKGEYLAARHGDARSIAELRKLLVTESEPRQTSDTLLREKQQIREQAHAVLRDLLAELEASPLANTFTTARRIRALKAVLEHDR